MIKNAALNSAWEGLLAFTDGVVAVRNDEKKVLLAHVDGASFSLVANDIQHFDSIPDTSDYNVAVPWLWPLFREPGYDYLRPVAGRIRDPCTDCCPKLSWETIRDHHKRDAIQLATKAAKLALHTDHADTATRVEAHNYLREMDRCATR